MNYGFNKFILSILFLALLFKNSNGQNTELNTENTEGNYTGLEFELNQSINGNNFYVARDRITMKQGFRWRYDNGTAFKARLNEKLNVDVNYVDPANVVNPAYRQIDKNLTVGSLPGSINVTPAGSASYTIPLDILPGSGGMVPNLTISYNSMAGNSWLGLGFTLTGLSAITRCGKSMFTDGELDGIELDEDDRFMLDGQRLIAVPNTGNYGENETEYRTETETYSRIVSIGTAGNGPEKFMVYTRDGKKIEYGYTSDSRIRAGSQQDVLIWYINKVTDNFGNYMLYNYYNNDNIEAYPKSIEYTGNGSNAPYNKVEFFYERNRNDQSNAYLAGANINQTVLMHSIKLSYNNTVIKDYRLQYLFDQYSKLYSIKELNAGGAQVNETLFGWGGEINAYSQQVITDLSSDITAKYFPGDYNGDGKTDIIAVCHSLVNNEIETKLFIANDNGFSFTYQSFSTSWILPSDFGTFLPADVNADGNCDLVLLKTNGSAIVYTYNNGNFYTWAGQSFYVYPDYYDKLTPADINGDGIIDFLYPSNENSTVWKISGNTVDEATGVIAWSTWASFNMSVDKFKVADFNGDGKSDFMVLSEDGFTIYEFVKSSKSFETYIPVSILSGNYLTKNNPVFIGNFNGDAYIDILFASQSNIEDLKYKNNNEELSKDVSDSIINKRDSTSEKFDIPVSISWKISYLKGNNIAPDNLPITSSALPYYGIYHPAGGEITIGEEINIVDVDGDGKQDIMFVNPPLVNPNPSSIRILFNKGFHQFEFVEFSNIIPYCSAGKQLFGDYNGDGRLDILTNGQPVIGGMPPHVIDLGQDHMFQFYPNSKKNLVQVISDGMGKLTNIDYKLLTNAAVYEKNKNYNISTGYPKMVFQAPISVVANVSVCTSGDEKSSFNTKYFYRNAHMHLGGRGFLGFEEIETTNMNEGSKTKVTYSLQNQYVANEKYYDWMPVKTEVFNSAGTLLSKTENEYDVLEFGSQINLPPYPARYESHMPYVKKTTAYNYLRNEKSEVNAVYNAQYGAPTSITSTSGQTGGATEWTETITSTYKNFITSTDGGGDNNGDATYSRWIIGLPEKVTTNNTKAGETAYIRITDYNYNAGKLTSIVSDPNHAKSITQTFTYDAFGNVTTNTTSAEGKQIITQAVYDTKGRYKLKAINQLGHTITNVYEESTGRLLQTTDPNGLSTYFTYDGAGNLKLTKLPDQNYIEEHVLWASSITEVNKPYNAWYASKKIPKNSDATYQFYDIFGRLISTAHKDYNGDWLYTINQYNDKHQLVQSSLPFKWGTTPTYTTLTYDINSRVTDKVGQSINIHYDFDGIKIKETNMLLGLWNEKTTDSKGLVTKSEDGGNSIVYEYYSSGNVKNIISDNNTIYNEYDLLGYQTLLTDPNAGTIHYNYSAFGLLNYQINAKNERTDMVYDDLGRLITKIEPERTINYIYDNAENGIGMLASVSSSDGNAESFTYDRYGRKIAKTETIASVNYQYQYSYNQQGELETLTYPDGYKVKQIYDNNGYLKEVKDYQTNNAIWKGENRNVLGQWTQYLYGNGIRTNFTYDQNNMLSAIDAGSALNMSFAFSAGGQLLSRTDNRIHYIESFEYDVLNRLIKSTISNTNPSGDLVQNNTGSDASQVLQMNYLSNGNIASKSDAGNYAYSSPRPHAVTNITNNNGSISALTQDIRFFSNGMVSSITENNNKLNIFYGCDGQRNRALFYEGAALKQTTIYAGGLYEEITDITTNIVKRVHYIIGGDGVVAIYTTTNNTNGNMYYVHKDYLGSWLTITNAAGAVADRQSFDAWGRRRNTENWSYTGVATSFLFTRGYTGHEHIDAFNLINMNGRVYDPVVGRFISPDNYIQQPGNTQSLNRYSYCLNNPLMFTDPSGELVFAAVMVGIMVGMTINFTIQAFLGNLHTQGDVWKCLAIGAISGAAGAIAGGATLAAMGGGIGFYSGAVAGANAGIFGGFMNGVGNVLINGGDLGTALSAGVKAAIFGGLTGALSGGIVGGIQASKLGLNFWDGTGVVTMELKSDLSAAGNYSSTEIRTSDDIATFGDKNFPGHRDFVKRYSYGFDDLSFEELKSPQLNKFYIDMFGDIKEQFQPGYIKGLTIVQKTQTFSSPKITIAIAPSAATTSNNMTAVMGHEIIHAWHYYTGDIRSLGANGSEVIAYRYSSSIPHDWSAKNYTSFLDMANSLPPIYNSYNLSPTTNLIPPCIIPIYPFK